MKSGKRILSVIVLVHACTLFGCRSVDSPSLSTEQVVSEKPEKASLKIKEQKKTDSRSKESLSSKRKAEILSEAELKKIALENQEDKNYETVIDKGIRFTFKEVPSHFLQGVYMMTSGEKYEKIQPMMGLFSPRFAFSEDRNIVLYDQPPVDGQPQGNKILSVPVPAEMGDKVVGVISATGEGKHELILVDERRMKPGCFYLRNVTSEKLGMLVDNGEMFEMAPGESRFLEWEFSREGKNSHPAKIYRQNDKGEWYVTRQFVFLCRSGISEMVLMLWNAGLGRPDMQRISLAPENRSECR